MLPRKRYGKTFEVRKAPEGNNELSGTVLVHGVTVSRRGAAGGIRHPYIEGGLKIPRSPHMVERSLDNRQRFDA